MNTKRLLSLLRPSTLAFFREGRRLSGYSLLDWLHGYIYGRWPYFYIAIGRGTHPLARLFGAAIRRLACRCMGCGVCISRCSEKALVLVRDLSRSAPLDIAEIRNAGTAR
jgi:ferredoxin